MTVSLPVGLPGRDEMSIMGWSVRISAISYRETIRATLLQLAAAGELRISPQGIARTRAVRLFPDEEALLTAYFSTNCDTVVFDDDGNPQPTPGNARYAGRREAEKRLLAQGWLWRQRITGRKAVNTAICSLFGIAIMLNGVAVTSVLGGGLIIGAVAVTCVGTTMLSARGQDLIHQAARLHSSTDPSELRQHLPYLQFATSDSAQWQLLVSRAYPDQHGPSWWTGEFTDGQQFAAELDQALERIVDAIPAPPQPVTTSPSITYGVGSTGGGGAC